MMDRIISQMNNNRLSTSLSPSVDRDLLLLGAGWRSPARLQR